jgi:hypothetical protein
VERRFNEGLSYNFLFTWSKNLAGTAGTGWQYYNWALTKGPTTNDMETSSFRRPPMTCRSAKTADT